MKFPHFDFASRFWRAVDYLDRQLGALVCRFDHFSAAIICVLLVALVCSLLLLGFTLSLG